MEVNTRCVFEMLAKTNEEVLKAEYFMFKLLSSLEPCQKLRIQLSVEKENAQTTQEEEDFK